MPTKLLTALAALLITIVVFAAALALLPAELVFYGFMLTLIFSATVGVLLVAIHSDVKREQTTTPEGNSEPLSDLTEVAEHAVGSGMASTDKLLIGVVGAALALVPGFLLAGGTEDRVSADQAALKQAAASSSGVAFAPRLNGIEDVAAQRSKTIFRLPVEAGCQRIARSSRRSWVSVALVCPGKPVELKLWQVLQR